MCLLETKIFLSNMPKYSEMGFEECDYVSDIGNCVRGSLKRDTGIDEAVRGVCNRCAKIWGITYRYML